MEAHWIMAARIHGTGRAEESHKTSFISSQWVNLQKRCIFVHKKPMLIFHLKLMELSKRDPYFPLAWDQVCIPLFRTFPGIPYIWGLYDPLDVPWLPLSGDYPSSMPTRIYSWMHTGWLLQWCMMLEGITNPLVGVKDTTQFLNSKFNILMQKKM